MIAVSLPEPLAAVIFDFDGVLVESLDIKRDAFAALYRPHGTSVVDQVVAYHNAHPGVSRYEKIRHFENHLLGRSPTEQEVLGLANAFSALVESAVVACPEVSGASTLLQFLSERKPCFVASATPGVELQRIIDQRGWRNFFQDVMGSPATKEKNLQLILQRLGVPGHQCLMVGDAIADFDAARRCGMCFFGRVAQHAESPFPPEVPLVGNMLELMGHLSAVSSGVPRN